MVDMLVTVYSIRMSIVWLSGTGAFKAGLIQCLQGYESSCWLAPVARCTKPCMCSLCSADLQALLEDLIEW